MKKNIFKIIGLFFLLTISFIYTEKIFTVSRNNDPLMKEIIKYKKEYDYKPVNAIIKDNEIILGLSGVSVNLLDSYKNMKEKDSFNKNKIIKNIDNPKNSIVDNFDYYIISSNKIKKNIYILLKVNNINELEYLDKINENIALFISDEILNKYYIDTNLEIYNLNINTKFSDTNKIIEENYNKSLYCLNENKDEKRRIICKQNRMYSIKPTLINPSIETIKKNLENGIIVSYDLSKISINQLTILTNIIETKGYKIDKLSNLIKE